MNNRDIPQQLPIPTPYFDYGMSKERIKHGRFGDAGYDIYNNSPEDIVIPPHETKLVPLGFGLKLPYGKALFQSSRSGHAQHSLSIGFIPVDSNYTGEIKAITTNNSSEPITIKKDERFGQFVVLDVYDLDFIDDEPENHSTDRGDKGFGSSGKA